MQKLKKGERVTLKKTLVLVLAQLESLEWKVRGLSHRVENLAEKLERQYTSAIAINMENQRLRAGIGQEKPKAALENE